MMIADAETDPAKPTRQVPTGGGWRIIASKELADAVQSIRFVVLLALIGLAALASVQAATGPIQDAADAASQTPSVFLLLFTLAADRVPAFHEFVGILGPLLGIAFGFDAISAERSDRTLSRLVAQPIHRDDVINGKFVAGVAAIAIVLTTITAMVVAYGMWSLGQTPGPSDLARVLAFLVVSIVYIALWLALAILVSVIARRASTAALVTIAAWLVFSLFGGLIAGIAADAISPINDPQNLDQVLDNARTELTLLRFSPDQLYSEATGVLLSPERQTTGILLLSVDSQALPSTLSLGQSILLAWWQVMAITAGVIVIFTAAYITFLKQEIRA